MSEPLSDFRLRRGVRRDAEAIRTLLGSVFPDNPKADLDVLNWQYWENPFGEAVLWVHEAGGRIVGSMARLPVVVAIAGRRERGVITADAVTAPEVRGRGLHSTKRDASNADGCRQGLVVGFHFQGPGSPLPSTDAPSVGPVDHYVLPVDPTWVARRFRLPRAAVTPIVRRALRRRSGPPALGVDRVPTEVNELWSALEQDLPYGIVKDEPWWRWRYEGHPRHPYRYFVVRERGRLTGVAAARTRRSEDAVFAYVLDALALNPGAMSSLMREVGSAYDGIVGVSLRARAGTLTARLAAQAGMRRVWRRWEPNPLTLHVRDMCGTRPELLEHPWAVGWAESDHL